MNEITAVQEAIDVVLNARRENTNYLPVWNKLDRIYKYLNRVLEGEMIAESGYDTVKNGRGN